MHCSGRPGRDHAISESETLLLLTPGPPTVLKILFTRGKLIPQIEQLVAITGLVLPLYLHSIGATKMNAVLEAMRTRYAQHCFMTMWTNHVHRILVPIVYRHHVAIPRESSW